MCFVFDVKNPLLYVAGCAGVTGKIPPRQLAVPRPIVFGIGSRVDTHIPASGLNVAFKSILL